MKVKWGGSMRIWVISALMAALVTFAFFFVSVASGAFFGARLLSDVGGMLVLVIAFVPQVSTFLLPEIYK